MLSAVASTLNNTESAQPKKPTNSNSMLSAVASTLNNTVE